MTKAQSMSLFGKGLATPQKLRNVIRDWRLVVPWGVQRWIMPYPRGYIIASFRKALWLFLSLPRSVRLEFLF